MGRLRARPVAVTWAATAPTQAPQPVDPRNNATGGDPVHRTSGDLKEGGTTSQKVWTSPCGCSVPKLCEVLMSEGTLGHLRFEETLGKTSFWTVPLEKKGQARCSQKGNPHVLFRPHSLDLDRTLAGSGCGTLNHDLASCF